MGSINICILNIVIWVVMGREDLAPTSGDDVNNSVNMIGHNDKCTQFYVREMNWNFVPPFLNDFTVLIEIYFPINNFAEQTLPPLSHDAYVIRTPLAIIISLQSNG